MIRTNPPLDTMEKYYQYYHEQIKKMKKLTDGFSDDGTSDPYIPIIFSALKFIFAFLDSEAGMTMASIQMIKKISEMIDQRATQEQMREQIQIIEKRVVTTLVPMDELIKKAKALQDADPCYIG
ncbi:MAG TPA: hypothetical protein VJ571_04085 [Candidatus Nitrosotalea sp.]|nr:hypothetical protein [Candidatus Nitrosotalea sp.]